MSFNTISALVRGQWLIEPSYVQAHLPLIHGILTGSNTGAELFKGNAEMEMPFVYANGKRIEAFTYSAGSYQLNENAFPQNSIAVIPLIGPVMKYNGDCGEPGMIKRASWVDALNNSSKISGFIFYIDSPGGQADGTPQFTEQIKAITKPTIAFVDGGAFSAAMWVASACNAIVLSHEFTSVGSVGAYTTIVDYQGYFEKQGYKVTTIYPDESSEKNLSYRKALAGDFSQIKKEVGELATYFIKSFAENRGSRLTSTEWNKGATYNASDAIRLGMADHIGSFDFAVLLIQDPTLIPKKTSTPQTKTNMNFENVAALSGIENPTQEQIDLANAELTTANITHVTLVPESFITEASAVTEQNTQLSEELAAANTLIADLTEQNESIAQLVSERDQARTEITELNSRLASLPGASHTTTVGNDTPPANEEDDTEAILNSLPHNQNADRVLG